MRYTTHYSLNIPEGSDLFNVEHFNDNSTKIDNTLYELSQEITPVSDHISDQNNPHQVTKAQVGLGNVDNTSDADKPVSSAMQTELNKKVNSSALATVATSGAYSDLTGTPTLGTAASKDVASSGDASSTEVVMGNDSRLSNSRPASDVYSWAKAATKPTYTSTEVGAIAATDKGSNGGVAELDSSGKVPSSQLPSYVDDVIEGYYKATDGKFYKESTYTTEIAGEAGKVYVDLNTDTTWRWSGSAFVQIKGDLALGETSSTAYRGDRGKTAYDHSQTTSGNPHNVSASDVGLGNVGNFKAVSTEANQGLSSTEQANARDNIGAISSSSIPTVNNAVLTIQKNGTNVQTFSANASTDVTANITVPTATSELTNDSGFVTTDTDTHRPIQVKGTQILGDNTTPLNFAEGTNVTLSNSGGTITISASGGSAAVQSDWDESDTTSDAYIKNKPTLQTFGVGYGTCSTSSSTAEKSVTMSGYVLNVGGIVSVKFTNAVGASATMNINSKGAKSIYHFGAAIKDGLIEAGDTAMFMYDGTYYHLIGTDRAVHSPTMFYQTSKPSLVVNGEIWIGSATV